MANTPKIYFDMDTHELKTWPEFFEAVKTYEKQFEIRKNDRDFKVGDRLLLWEYHPDLGYLDEEPLCRYISYILHGGQFGVKKGYVVLGLKVTPVIGLS